MISRGFLVIVARSMASVLASCAAQAPDSFAPAPASGAGPGAPAAGAPVPPDLVRSTNLNVTLLSVAGLAMTHSLA